MDSVYESDLSFSCMQESLPQSKQATDSEIVKLNEGFGDKTMALHHSESAYNVLQCHEEAVNEPKDITLAWLNRKTRFGNGTGKSFVASILPRFATAKTSY